MQAPLFSLFVVGTFLGCLSGLDAQLPVAPELPESKAEAAQEETLPLPSNEDLDQLVAGLGAESFALREKAHAALEKYSKHYPEHLKTALLPKYQESTDPEIRFRLVSVLFKSFRQEMRNTPKGFLGIWMHSQRVVVKGKKAVGSILVRQVMVGSAAEQAGLRAGDKIIAVDDLTFPIPVARQGRPAPLQPSLVQDHVDKFKSYIESKQRGDKVTLKIQRQQQQLSIDVQLGKRPAHLTDRSQEAKEERAFDQWIDGQLQGFKAQ